MPVIVLLRHGQASFGAADYDNLSDLGRQQASLAGQALATRGLRVPVMVSGGLRRQRDTIRLAATSMAAGRDGTGQVHHEDARFDEYDHIGLASAAVEKVGGEERLADPRMFQQVLDGALHAWVEANEADGWQAFAGGAMAAVTDLAENLERGQDAVVATSGGVIAAIVSTLLSGGADTVVALNRIVVNAGFTTLLAGSTGIGLLTFNDHAHFTGIDAALRTYR